MKRSTFVLVATLALGGVVWLARPSAAAEAAGWARPGGYPAAVRTPPIVNPGHMPGWDWWRTYPWSPYNYGRNPYNPLILPYPYPYPAVPPVVLPPAAAPGPVKKPAVPPADTAAADVTVSGPLPTPPPGSAMIRVRVPGTWAKVKFDGRDTDSMGRDRYFVTPRLEAGQARRYLVTASWSSQGGRSTEERQPVQVKAGQIATVDFTR